MTTTNPAQQGATPGPGDEADLTAAYDCVQCGTSDRLTDDGYCRQCARENALIEAMRIVVGPGPITMRLVAVSAGSQTWRFESGSGGWAVLEVGVL